MTTRTTLTLKRPENKKETVIAKQIAVKPPENNQTQAKRKSSNNITEKAYNDILTSMQERYPVTFPKTKPVPLAIGIHDQLFTGKLLYSKTITRKFLDKYTKTTQYRQQLIVGNNRYNLDGSVASTILEQEVNQTTQKQKQKGKKKQATHDAFVKKVMENPATAKEFLDEFLPIQYKELIDLSTLQVEKESFVELRHEVAKKSCFPLSKQERKPSLPRDDPRVLNKERTRQCNEEH